MSRVLRGGSWNNNPRNCRAANRNDNAPDNRNNNIGFRVCRGAHIVIIPAKRQGAFWRSSEIPADHGLPDEAEERSMAQAGTIPFAEFDASVCGWINHVRHADSWGLRRHVLAPFVLKPGDMPRGEATNRPEKKSRAPLRGAQ